MFTAILDSCTLWPSLLRDFLLSLSIEGSYRAIWSSAILDEVERNEVQKLMRRGAEQDQAARLAKRLISNMRSGFTESEVRGWEHLEGTFGLPDIDDEHVLAAAVIGGAGAIVTENLRDFPHSLIPESIQILTPREFTFDAVEVDPIRALEAVRQIARRSGGNGRPTRTEVELVDTLAHRYGLNDAMNLLREL